MILDEVRARRIVLHDAAGNERAILETSDHGPAALALLDPAGRLALGLHAGPDGPGFVLFDESGSGRLFASLEGGFPCILMHDERGARLRVTCGRGEPGFELLNEAGDAVGVLTVRNGHPAFYSFGARPEWEGARVGWLARLKAWAGRLLPRVKTFT